jgi:hypothetical protein
MNILKESARPNHFLQGLTFDLMQIYFSQTNSFSRAIFWHIQSNTGGLYTPRNLIVIILAFWFRINYSISFLGRLIHRFRIKNPSPVKMI